MEPPYWMVMERVTRAPVTVNKKVHAALEAGLHPIICVGESLEQREMGVTGRTPPPRTTWRGAEWA